MMRCLREVRRMVLVCFGNCYFDWTAVVLREGMNYMYLRLPMLVAIIFLIIPLVDSSSIMISVSNLHRLSI